ncbi:hypothetical protein [Algivirga pacifica]|uniref:Uncharacterized protein n=1 Tax=Algivirga pacifica TaxID=1162670 RepID=A0ABP9DF99_9BACT
MKRVVLASTLKPVDDSRMYEKFALTLASDYEVIVLGFHKADPSFQPQHPQVRCIPVQAFKRFPRWQSNFRYHNLFKELKPDILIVHTIELLAAAYYYKLQNPSCRLVYDVQENYVYNFWYKSDYKGIKRYLLSLAAWGIEQLGKKLINLYTLAESTYKQERSFPLKKTLVLENKYFPILPAQKVNVDSSSEKNLQLLLCGTLSTTYGTREAIALCIRLHQAGSPVHLHIMGSCHEPSLMNWIEQVTQEYPFITLEGGDSLVPHHQIIKAMLQSHYVLLPYPPNPSTQNCIPTKLYECLALGIPMIIQENPLWKKLCKQYHAGFSIDYINTPTPSIIETLNITRDYYPNGPITEALWNEEGELLKQHIQQLIFDK